MPRRATAAEIPRLCLTAMRAFYLVNYEGRGAEARALRQAWDARRGAQ